MITRTVTLLWLSALLASAQVVTILGSDTISSSRPIINNNFSYLNGIKVESASNTGSSGIGLFKSKSGTDLAFYKLASANSLLTIALSGTDFLQFTINPANFTNITYSGTLTRTGMTDGCATWVGGSLTTTTVACGSGGGGSGGVSAFSVTSVPSWLTASVATATTTPALTLAPAGSQLQNRFLGSPNGSSGTVSLRAIVAADLPSITVLSGVNFPASPALDTHPLVTSVNNITYTAIPNCIDSGGQHLNYNTTTHLYTCGSTGSGASGGTMTTISMPTVPAWLSASISNPTTTPAISLTALTGQTANRVLASPNSSTGAVSLRALVAGDLPTISLINGVTYPASPSVDQIPVVTSSNTITYKSIPDCDDAAGQHLNYDTTTKVLSCGTSSSGGGGGGGASTGTLAAMPGSCSAGAMYVATDQPRGEQLYLCYSGVYTAQHYTSGSGGTITVDNTNKTLVITPSMFPTLASANTYAALNSFAHIKVPVYASTPTSADCDSAGEEGKIGYSTAGGVGQKLYACKGTAGWEQQGGSGGGGGASWTKYTKTFSNLTASGLTNITLFSLTAQQVLRGVVIKHSTAFTGGGLSQVIASVGGSDASQPDYYAPGLNVFTAPSNTNFERDSGVGKMTFAADNVNLYFLCTGNFCNGATAGSVDVWVLVETLP